MTSSFSSSELFNNSVLEARSLSGGYDRQRVVEAVSLQLRAGEWLSLVGANGSGKSTLLRLMSRLLSPQQGAAYLNGRDIHQLSPTQVAQNLALLPQQQTLPEGLTVYQLVSMGRSPHQPWWRWEVDAAGQRQIQQALHWTEMVSYRHFPVTALSGGERQRAFLALALAQNPQVLLLDEPTTYLDIHYQLQLLELLKRLNQQQQLSIITVLHDINLAVRYSDRLAMLRQGYLWTVGPVSTVLTPDNLRQVFEVEAAIISTPIGPQICPIAASHSSAPLTAQVLPSQTL
ncbi:MAG: ABC transporter ATP-binding protein [Cyanobacteria bacterium J06554_6]